MIYSGTIGWLGVACLVSPVLIYFLDGYGVDVKDDENMNFHRWLMGKPIHVIVMMQSMVFVGFLLMMAGIGSVKII